MAEFRTQIKQAVKAAAARILAEFFGLQVQLARLVGRQNARSKGDLSEPIDPEQLNNILLLGLGEIGDVVMLSPLLRELRRCLPGRRITLIVTPRVRALVEKCPYVDEILVYDPYAPLLLRPLVLPWRAWITARRSLRTCRFDLAIQPRWDEDRLYLAFLAYFSGARWRIGYSETVLPRKQCLNYGFDRLYTHLLSNAEYKHEVEHYLDIVRFLGGEAQDTRQELWLDPADIESAGAFLTAHDIRSNDLLVAIHPGANHNKRRWPVERYAEVGAWLVRQQNARIVIVGGPDIQDAAQGLAEAIGHRAVSTAGQFSLRQTGALLQRCAFYLGNDTGPAHLAAAAGIPAIVISCHPLHGSPEHVNSPLRVRPWGVPQTILQPSQALLPCSKACTAKYPHCIEQVDTDSVKAAVLTQCELLSRQPPMPLLS